VLGFTITPLFAASVEATWDRVLSGIEATLCFWRGRRLETLLQRVQILETYALSKAWYFAQAMPLPSSTSQHPPAIATAARLRRLIADFLWEGRFRRLAFDECHIKPEAGGLSISCPQTRAQSLRANQTCRQLAAVGRPALHLALWLGISLHGFLPIVASAGLTLEGPPPPQYGSLLELLREVFSLDCINTSRLQDVQSAAVYKELMATPPNPRIERAMPGLPWTVIWPRLAGPGLSALAVDTHFSALHDLLGVRANQHPWRQAQSPDCPHCADHPPAPPETILSHFTVCRRTSAVCAFLLFRASLALGRAISDQDLFFLAWPPSVARLDASVALAVTTYTRWAWETKDLPDVLIPADLRTRVALELANGLVVSIF
jgi:hypothetical protein